MNKNFKFALILLAVCFIGFVAGIVLKHYTTPVKMNPLPSYDETVELIDSLEKNESQIDTVYIRLKANENNYKEIFDSVLDLSGDESCVFFIEYIADQRERLDSINQTK